MKNAKNKYGTCIARLAVDRKGGDHPFLTIDAIGLGSFTAQSKQPHRLKSNDQNGGREHN